MSSNRFYTLIIVPEKTAQVRRVVIPAWLFKGAAAGLAMAILLSVVMLANYWYVMNQIGENKQLKMENRRLKQQVQVFQNKVTTIESTMERVKTFATRLKVITNIEDRGSLLQSLNGPLPDANTNVGKSNTPFSSASSVTSNAVSDAEEPIQTENASLDTTLDRPPLPAPSASPGNGLGASIPFSGANNMIPPPAWLNTSLLLEDPEELLIRREYDELDERFSELNRETLFVEQMLQDQYELLADQKAFLQALPTRKPAIGYFTSGFGVRRSPFGGKTKMHEGLDIANRPGTQIRAPADGIVIYADSKAGYGQTVIIDHGYGLETWYAHAKKLMATRGQKVRRGEVIALLGNSGRSTGPHLHYEVRVNGTPVDPWTYILEN